MAFVGVIALGLGVSALYSLFAGWMFMLLVGVVHHEWIPALPTIGFGWAVLVAFLIRMVIANVSASSSD